MIDLRDMRTDMAEVVIDLNVLSEMDMDLEFFQEIASMYLHQATSLIGEIKARIHVDDRSEVRKIVHGLKGISANIGAVAMAEICRQLEQLQACHSPKEITVLLHELDNVFEETRFQIERLMGDYSVVTSFQPASSWNELTGVQS